MFAGARSIFRMIFRKKSRLWPYYVPNSKTKLAKVWFSEPLLCEPNPHSIKVQIQVSFKQFEMDESLVCIKYPKKILILWFYHEKVDSNDFRKDFHKKIHTICSKQMLCAGRLIFGGFFPHEKQLKIECLKIR